MPTPVLQIIVASTRPGRVGLPVAQWFHSVAEKHTGFTVELVDLAEVNLPFFDEPNHPRLGQYVHEHTHAWSRTVARAGAFVIVTPEYNHSFNAVLKNALDYLHREWQDKPVGFVSYGGVAAGARAVQSLEPVLVALGLRPTRGGVNIPRVPQFLGEDGAFTPDDVIDAAAQALLVELELAARTFESLRP